MNDTQVKLNLNDIDLLMYMQLAKKKGISFNQLCNEALEDYLGADLDLDFANNPHPADRPFEPTSHEQTK